MSTFLIKRGKAALHRTSRAHLARYDAHGRIAGAWCPFRGYDMSCNLPLGLKVCGHCARAAAASQGGWS